MAIYDDKTGVTLLDSQIPFVPGILPPKLERHYMNPIRYRVNYRIVPGFAVLCGICLILVLILGNIDDQTYMPVMIGLFAVMAVTGVWLLMTVPKTREKELALERERYDFEAQCQPGDTMELEALTLKFSGNGLTVNDKFYWYGQLKPRLVTSNRFNRVWLAIQFGQDPMGSVFVPLGPEMLHMLAEYDIPLENPRELQYLLTHKTNAFAQIYASGSFTVFED